MITCKKSGIYLNNSLRYWDLKILRLWDFVVPWPTCNSECALLAKLVISFLSMWRTRRIILQRLCYNFSFPWNKKKISFLFIFCPYNPMIHCIVLLIVFGLGRYITRTILITNTWLISWHNMTAYFDMKTLWRLMQNMRNFYQKHFKINVTMVLTVERTTKSVCQRTAIHLTKLPSICITRACCNHFYHKIPFVTYTYLSIDIFFRGASLSRNRLVTHSLTHSFLVSHLWSETIKYLSGILSKSFYFTKICK